MADLYERVPGRPAQLARFYPAVLWPYRVEFRMPEGHDSTYLCMISVGMQPPLHEQRVKLVWTEPNFGGLRPWFACPDCGALRNRLYLNGTGLSCRRCCGLAYDSQQMSRADRRGLRIGKIYARLGNPVGPAWMLSKPPRMHWRTFDRLVAELTALQNEAIEDASREMVASLERLKRGDPELLALRMAACGAAPPARDGR